MDSETLTIIGLALTCIIAGSGWVRSVLKSHNHAELQKVFATRADIDGLREQINGARQSLRKDVEALGRRFTQVEAEADLAIKNADTAISECHETRQLLEIYHEQMTENFVKPFQENHVVLREILTTLATHGAYLERLMKSQP